MQLQTMLDMGYRAIHRARLQIMYGGEGGARFPWQSQSAFDGGEGGGEHDELAGGLAFPPGLLWYDNPDRVLRYNWEYYEPGIGLASGNIEGTFMVARHYVATLSPGSQIFTITHNFSKLFPAITIYQRNILNRWYVYDPLQNGGSIEQDLISAGFDMLIDMGANVDYGAVAVLVG